MFWKSPKFKKEQEDWYQRLQKAGFVDIEKEGELLQSITHPYRHKNEVNRELILEYHLMLSECVKEEKWESDLDFLIMERFSQGFKNSEIVAELEKIGQKRHRKTVMFIRRKYEFKWGIIYWKPMQLTSNRPKKRTAS
jgi:hypothetical protein